MIAYFTMISNECALLKSDIHFFVYAPDRLFGMSLCFPYPFRISATSWNMPLNSFVVFFLSLAVSFTLSLLLHREKKKIETKKREQNRMSDEKAAVFLYCGINK